MTQILPLIEGAFTVDSSKKFVPFDVETENLQERPKGSILVEIQPFVVITSRDIIILDTGLGHELANGKMQIHENLSRHGINADDVTKVILSHLHKDHSGGILKPNKRIASFENATYYINEKEWNYALENESASYKKDNFFPLSRTSKLVLTPDKGDIDDYIQYEVTGGHCPWHQAITITEGDEITFFGGDVAPQLQQMKNRFKAKYDFDGAKSMELRQKWWEESRAKNQTFLFYHDLKNPVVKRSDVKP